MIKIIILITFGLTLFVSVRPLNAQSALGTGKIPKDLEITLTRNSRFENYSINIHSDGSWKSGGQFGLPIADSNPKLSSRRIGKVTKSDLQWLISEFQRVDFLHFKSSLPQEENVLQTSISDQATEEITFRSGGETTRLQNYLGDQGVRAHLLANLANKIRKITTRFNDITSIPTDFVAIFSENSGSQQSYYKITSDGLIYCYFHSNMPPGPNSRTFRVVGQQVSKPPELSAKIPKTRLKSILLNMNKYDLFAIRDGILGKTEGCRNDGLILHDTVYDVTTRINGIRRNISMSRLCEPIPGTQADGFYRIYTYLNETIIGVKAKPVESKEFF